MSKTWEEHWAWFQASSWQEESKIAYIRNEIAKDYEAIYARNKAEADAAHEARFGRQVLG